MSLTFLVGSAADVFADGLATAIDSELRSRYALPAPARHDTWESEPVNAAGWRLLQERVLRTLDAAPQLTTVDAYQAVYVPVESAEVAHLPIANAADPLQVGSLPALIDELRRFAADASLPIDELELMRLGLRYLESDEESDLDVQTYVQLMLSARQAAARNQSLWVVV